MTENFGTRRRKVSLFAPSLTHGGVQRSMVVLANAFAKGGWQVHLVLAQAKGDYLAEVSSAVRIVDLHSTRVLASLPRLTRYLRSEMPDALIGGMPHVNVVAITAKLLARSRTKVIVTEQIDRSGAGKRSFRGRALDRIASVAYRFADHVVGVSDGVSENVATVFGVPREQVHTIYNPVDTELVATMAAEPVSLPWTGESFKLIVAVGRLVRQKDFATLLGAFALVLNDHNARLVIIGDGPLRRELETLARELRIDANVHFTGFQRNPFCWMKRADLFVLSSKFEGLGNVIVEAMACGTPVVATDCPSGPKEILEGGRWGRLVPPGHPLELAGAMIASLSDASRHDVRLRAADFAAAVVAAQYAKLFAED